jgi:hypothetical protein
MRRFDVINIDIPMANAIKDAVFAGVKSWLRKSKKILQLLIGVRHG